MFQGGVAQLGEHLLCKQGVVGSIPIVSIGRLHWASPLGVSIGGRFHWLVGWHAASRKVSGLARRFVPGRGLGWIAVLWRVPRLPDGAVLRGVRCSLAG